MGLGLLHAALWCGRTLGVAASPPLARAQHLSLGRRLAERCVARPISCCAPSAPGSEGAAGAQPAGADLRPRFERLLCEGQLIGRGATVLVLVSGGRDSVALLHLLAHARPALDLRLHVLHFNHGTRAECGEEEAFVRGLAGVCAAEFHVRRLERVPASGLQAKTRSWRRAEATALLARLAPAPPRDAVIALGHHADDDVETILLKWLRGAHITRLAGMRARDGAFVRPLLPFGRDELTAWLLAGGLEWREDSSNATPEYKRNRVRLELVPLLQQLTGGSLGARLADLVTQGAHARELLQLHAGGGEAEPPGARARAPQPDADGQLDLPALLALPAAVQTEALHGFISARAGRPSDYAKVQRALGLLRGGRPQLDIHLAGGWLLRRAGARLRVCPLQPGARAEAWRTARVAPAAGGAVGEAVHVAHPSECEVELLCLPAGAVGPPPRGGEGGAPRLTLYNVPPGSRLLVRTRREGDEFAPAWRGRPLKLKDFLRGQKVPLHERDSVRLVTCEPGVDGAGSAERAAPRVRAQVLAVYPSHVSRLCSRDEGVHPPLSVAITPERAPLPLAEVEEGDDEVEGEL